MSKYLITGVSGFVGKYFVKYLHENESSYEVFGIDRNPVCNDESIKYKNIDLNDENEVNSIIKDFKPDYILHLASMSSVGQSWKEPNACLRNNSNIMLNLVEAIHKNSLKTRILSIGSSEEYGDGITSLKETMSLNPENPYAIAKVWQEMIGKLYAKNFGVDVIMTRSFNHIGPGQSDRFVIPSFMKQLVNIANGAENKMLVGNIEVARDFTDVRDVVDAYYKLLHYGKSGEVYNVCSGNAYKLKDIISIAEGILCIKANIEIDENLIRPNDVMLVQGDNTKLCSELGWKRKFEIKESIKSVIERIKNEI